MLTYECTEPEWEEWLGHRREEPAAKEPVEGRAGRRRPVPGRRLSRTAPACPEPQAAPDGAGPSPGRRLRGTSGPPRRSIRDDRDARASRPAVPFVV